MRNREPVSSALSPVVSYAFKDSPTPEQEAEAARAIAAVIETGYSCLRRSISGSGAQVLVQCAAEGLPVATYRRWAQAFPAHTTAPAGNCYLTAREIGWLLDSGFTRASTRSWFGERPSIVRKSAAEGVAALRDHGWTPAQSRAVRDAFRSAKAWTSWAPVGPERFDLSLRAGLTPTVARRLLRRGEWDERTLETLAALRA